MRKIDETVKRALSRLEWRCGSVYAMSKLLGVSHSTVIFWRSGRIRNISTDTWSGKVYPVLEEEFAEMSPGLSRSELYEKYFEGDPEEDRESLVYIPVLLESDLLCYDMPLEKISSFAERKTDHEILFCGRPGMQYYGVLLENLPEKYQIPWRTCVIFQENIRLKPGSLVLVQLSHERDLKICNFLEDEEGCYLQELYSDSHVSKWKKDETCSGLNWAFPIVRMQILCRDHEGKSSGGSYKTRKKG